MTRDRRPSGQTAVTTMDLKQAIMDIIADDLLFGDLKSLVVNPIDQWNQTNFNPFGLRRDDDSRSLSNFC
jgi:hypothetical protein